MKKIILLLLLLPVNIFAFEVNEYKWVTVTHDKNWCDMIPWAQACYTSVNQTINIVNYLDQSKYEYTLKHEHAHHVHFVLMSKEDRDLWERVTNQEIMLPILEAKGIGTRVKFATVYAWQDIYEDFAESATKRYDGEFDSYKDLKMLLAKYLYNKYTD